MPDHRCWAASTARTGAELACTAVTVLRVALAQLNPTVGDLDGNLTKLIDAYDRAEAAGCDIVAFPELSITGYPPEDLVLKPGFVADNLDALSKFAARTGRCAAVVGFVDQDRDLYNAAAVCADGEIIGTYRKRLLPNTTVFDEARYFTPGHLTDPLELYVIGGVKVGISICEDIWSPFGPVAEQAAAGAELSININGSPYHTGKSVERERMLATRASDSHAAIVYVNQVGGQDELVFDGASVVFDARGQPVRSCAAVRGVAPDRRRARAAGVPQAPARPAAAGSPSRCFPRWSCRSRRSRTPDRPWRCWPNCSIPTGSSTTRSCSAPATTAPRTASPTSSSRLSGGIDSTIVACVAVDALGADHVHGVSMPSRYSSDHSKSDAQLLADNLGIDYRTISIEPAFQAYLDMLAPSFEGREPGLTYENIQSRCRGQLLMALSNEFGWMVLTTGNKSEMAVGYFTIYGDSVGGYGVIKDVLKTRVYDLCRYVNRTAGREIVPEAVITKPPSAELRPDQRDDQSLPPYEVLDPILQLYVEDDRTAAEIIELGHDEAMVRRVTRLVDIAEYKRRQCPPGVRVSRKAFGKDRRLPITSGYRG